MRASARNPWLVFAVVFASGVVMMMGQYKVAPLMGTLVDYFDVDAAVGGWLMSAFSFAGIALGIPAAIILGKAGARRAGTIAIGCSAVGNVAGMLATEETIAVLIVARVLEGVGVAVLGVVAPAVIARLFDERRQGLPLGIWSTWIAAGMLFSYPVAVPLADAFGTWKAVWCLCAVLSTLTEILYFCIVRPPEREACRNGREAQARRPFAAGRSFYALIAAYVFFSSAMAAFNTYAPAYLQYGLGASATAASLLSTFISAGALLGGLAAAEDPEAPVDYEGGAGRLRRDLPLGVRLPPGSGRALAGPCRLHQGFLPHVGLRCRAALRRTVGRRHGDGHSVRRAEHRHDAGPARHRRGAGQPLLRILG